MLDAFVRRLLRRFGIEIAWWRWDARLSDFLALLCRQYRIDCVLDVGASYGEFVSRLRLSGYRGDVISFEPVPSVFVDLKGLSQRDPQWRAYQLAFGLGAAAREINVATEGGFSSFLDANGYGRETFPQMIPTERVAVPMRRLDDFLDETFSFESAPRLLLKTDTQGMDLDVIRSAGRWLEQTPVIVSECSLLPIYEGMPLFEEHVAYLRGLGYEIAGLYPVSRDAHQRLIEVDCVMVRPAG
jgi:FkbM family methyltransferase